MFSGPLSWEKKKKKATVNKTIHMLLRQELTNGLMEQNGGSEIDP